METVTELSGNTTQGEKYLFAPGRGCAQFLRAVAGNFHHAGNTLRPGDASSRKAFFSSPEYSTNATSALAQLTAHRGHEAQRILLFRVLASCRQPDTPPCGTNSARATHVR